MAKKFVKGLEGIAAAETNLSKIDGIKGELIYRGYSIFDLAEKSSFEETVYLLWYAKLPNKKNLNKFKKDLNKNMKLNSNIKNMIESFPKTVVP
ncbi:citrate/2-methylcitrate synthase, partial [archaeon]|nr:citrate/2-methylcitrate synthase [archaeon]